MRKLKTINNYYILIGKWILRILLSPIYVIFYLSALIYSSLAFIIIPIEETEYRRWEWVEKE